MTNGNQKTLQFSDESRALDLKAGKSLHVLTEVGGNWLDLFWVKITKKGDVLTYTDYRAEHLKKGEILARGKTSLWRSEPLIVATGSALRKRNHLTLHPSDPDEGFHGAVLHGHAGRRNRIKIDLRTLKAGLQEVFQHRLGAADRYPIADRAKVDGVCIARLFRPAQTACVKFFVSPIGDALSMRVPFDRYSADFVSETQIGAFLFQIRVEFFTIEHASEGHLVMVPSAP